jgi:hypothetical protein
MRAVITIMIFMSETHPISPGKRHLSYTDVHTVWPSMEILKLGKTLATVVMGRVSFGAHKGQEGLPWVPF